MSDPKVGETAEILKAAAEATTGKDKPDTAIVSSQPPELALRMLAFGGPALSACIMFLAIMIGGAGLSLFGFIPLVPRMDWPDRVAELQVQGLVGIAGILAIILGVVVFRLASGGIRRAEVKVGPANITVESGDPQA